MSLAAQTIEGSIASGAVYALVGTGFAVLFRASKVLSFCQGAFMLAGAFLFYDAVTAWKMEFVLALVVSAAIVAALSALVYFAVFARLASNAAFATSVATIGLAGVLQAIFAIKFGTAPLDLPTIVSARAYHVLSAVVPTTDIVAVVIAAIMVIALVVALRVTPAGRRMEAVADNGPLAVHLGVSAARSSTIAWGIAGGTAAIAGAIFALRASVDPVGISNTAVYAFPAIILGGLDSVGGVLIGGMVVATVQNVTEATLGAGWVTIVSFALMLALLAIRPSGLFGQPDVVRL